MLSGSTTEERSRENSTTSALVEYSQVTWYTILASKKSTIACNNQLYQQSLLAIYVSQHQGQRWLWQLLTNTDIRTEYRNDSRSIWAILIRLPLYLDFGIIMTCICATRSCSGGKLVQWRGPVEWTIRDGDCSQRGEVTSAGVDGGQG